MIILCNLFEYYMDNILLGLFLRGLTFRGFGGFFQDEIRVRKGGGLIIKAYISATVTIS